MLHTNAGEALEVMLNENTRFSPSKHGSIGWESCIVIAYTASFLYCKLSMVARLLLVVWMAMVPACVCGVVVASSPLGISRLS